MDRRRFLAAVGGVGLAGCLGAQPDEPRYQGPIEGEDPDVVDIGYRQFTDEEVRTIRETARAIPYDELTGDIEAYVGEAVVFDGLVILIEERPDHVLFRISVDGDPTQLQWTYASWTGDPVEEAAAVTCWGEVMGEEVFTQAMGEELTVPAVALAAVDVLDG